MPPPDAAPLPRQLAREAVYQQLCRWIIDGALKPGEQLRDLDLARQLGVSRTPVREALRRLEDEGLIETALNRWTRVAPLRLAQAAELYPVIETLDVLALRLAAPQLTTEHLGALVRANAALLAAGQARQAAEAVQADSTFHAVWVEPSGNRELQSTLEQLKRKLRRAELAYFSADSRALVSVQEHAELIRALEGRSWDEAERLLRLNWQHSLQALQEAARR
ncbi:GntR family transcriptional regulator [Deinococcus alpinitundrae]|uniref:GntR family transcriptional regulator n=1 Tax=Deinococcus alpinitundrae TaxID=468913 RepID=UPI00137A0F0E|nr:GntR family transcriptional regulator [Deinococcus alpinitundrae]